MTSFSCFKKSWLINTDISQHSTIITFIFTGYENCPDCSEPRENISTGFGYQRICFSFLFWPPYLSSTLVPLLADCSFLLPQENCPASFSSIFRTRLTGNFLIAGTAGRRKLCRGLDFPFWLKFYRQKILYHQHGL